MYLDAPLNFRMGGDHLFVVSPKLLDSVDTVHGENGALAAGLSVGLSLSITRTVRVMPEVSAVYPAFVSGRLPPEAAALVMQAGLGILIGGD